MTDQITIQLILDETKIRIDRLAGGRERKNGMERFLENMADPDTRVYAFQWAESAIEEAVQRDCLVRLQSYAEAVAGKANEADELDSIRKYFEREMMNRATSSSQSTSTMSNLVQRLELKYYAQICSWLRGDYFSGF